MNKFRIKNADSTNLWINEKIYKTEEEACQAIKELEQEDRGTEEEGEEYEIVEIN